MTVYVATANPIKLRATEAVLREFGRDDRVVGVDIELDLPEQPLDDEVERGAVARARAAVAYRTSSADLGVGIEAGLLRLPSGRWLSTQICALVDRKGHPAVGTGPGYVLPDQLLAAVVDGETLREAFERVLGVSDPDRRGAVHFLSGGLVDREMLTREAVRMAMVSWRQQQSSPSTGA